ncbi:MAG: dTDP-4-dehydrorhamnose reductase [Candidatus Symbiothrix sp.]|nr:dTDP-4-dehydrorhamnose reductase [Candidatus Symbiothrix sp.]
MKNILVTGANGQLGNELQALFPQYPSFNFFATDVDTLDLCNKKEIENFIGQHNIHCIVNCAAYTAVDKAEDEAEFCYKINRDAVRNLAEAARGKAKIIHLSTDYVFDGTAAVPYRETARTHPQSVYGKSKKEGETVLLELAPESIIVRTAWLYSSFGNNFVKTILRLSKEHTALTVVSDQTGTPTCAADLAKALLDIIAFCENTQTFASGIYHYSNEGKTTWFDFAKKTFQLSGITACRLTPIPTSGYPTKATRPMYSVLDKTKIKNTFRLAVPKWEDSLEKCILRIKLSPEL